MVAFQTDKDDRTTGDGTFDRSTPAKPYIDCPPHGKHYFTDHLAFANNYFRKASNSRLEVEGTVLDSIYTLSKPMASYSPPRGSTTNPELGALITETWRLVDSLTPGIPYENYQLFAIFHAGAGHDIDFESIYGYDPTPFDLPSLYMGMPSLQKIYGSTFPGILVRHGADTIHNSMILPETENREISGIGGSSLLKLGTNGLIAASIGSFLGLPDLFDTKTGASGIGRFGLMDGQSIFSWGGAFPPEPSAWEKEYLGWANPIVVPAGTTIANLPAVSLSALGDTMYKVPITGKEYFLVENRNRDAHRDGDTVTLSTAGGVIKKYWQRDTTLGFYAFDQDSLYGNILDVDEFDISLPGGVSDAGVLYDGGILIWHIDENIINANFDSNTVNADPAHRGVNLLEADGSQDIGQTYSILDAGYTSEAGTALDFWYQGNSAPLRHTNEFTPATYPGSRSNNGANSHISMRNFSSRGPHMTVTIQVGDSLVQPLAGFPKYVDGVSANNSVKFGVTRVGPSLFFGGSAVYGWRMNGAPLLPNLDSSGLLVTVLQPNDITHVVGSIVLADTAAGGSADLIELQNGFASLGSGVHTDLRAFRLEDVNNDNHIDPFSSATLHGISSGPALYKNFLVWGDSAIVQTAKIDTAAPLLSSIPVTTSEPDSIVGVTLASVPPATASPEYVVITRHGVGAVVSVPGSAQADVTRQFPGTISAPAAAGYFSQAIGSRVVFGATNGDVFMVDQNLTTANGFPVHTGGEIINAPAIADIDGDGSKDIVVFSGNKIYAINAIGTVLDHFPITVRLTNNTLLTSPVIADIDQNGTQDIIAVTQEGVIVAYDKNGSMAAGFPIQSGPNNGSTPAVFSMANPLCLACRDTVAFSVASSDGSVYAYKTAGVPSGSTALYPWPQYMHDAQNSGFDPSILALVGPQGDFFPAASAYNWPNPVGPEQGYITHIRYYVKSDAQVTVKIYDMAGDLVAQFDKQGIGGKDNEFEWNVHDIQSGVYFAHIDAQGAADHGSVTVKIAVLK